MKTATIVNIQKFCLHDGPGIRTTVFFKGCPLNCLWCHNPESQAYNPELLLSSDKCTHCGRCALVCQHQAISLEAKGVAHNTARCMLCGACADHCVAGAREIAGRQYNIARLLREIEKDRPFYEQSQGGVTFSGGEALCQIDFLEELAKACVDQGISVAIDTCGYVPFANFVRIMPYVEVFLYDLKLMDSELHGCYTGQDNRLILDNLAKLSAGGAAIYLRIPVIAGINAHSDNITATIEYIGNLNIKQVNLLPYHDTGSGKYHKLNRIYSVQAMSKPSDDQLEQFKSMFITAGFNVKIGG